MTEKYTDKELKAFHKADLIDIVTAQEQTIIDLTPNARKHGSHPEKELKVLRNVDLIGLVKSHEITIEKIENAVVVEDKSHNLGAYGRKGLTATQVAQLQFDKSM